MNCFEEMKEIINDMQNISLIESLCTVADSFEGGVLCDSLSYGEVKKEMKKGPNSLECNESDMDDEDFMLHVEKELDISKEMELLNIWAEKEKEKRKAGLK